MPFPAAGPAQPNEQTTPDLDAMMRNSRVISDNPASQATEGEPATPATAATADPPPEPGPAPAPTSEPQPAAAGTEESGATRFKDHSAAEEGYRHARAKLTKTEQELADAKKKLSNYQEQEEQKRLAAEKERHGQEREDFAAGKNREAMDQIAALDPEMENYSTEVGRIWARTNLAIADYQPAASQLPPAAAAGATAPAETGEAAAPDRSADNAFIAAECEKQSLVADDPIFLHYASKSGSLIEANPSTTLADQVSWAIAETLKHKAQERDRILQEVGATLSPGSRMPTGPGGPGQPAGDLGTPVSLDAALTTSLESRRL